MTHPITVFVQCEAGSKIKHRHNELTLEHTGSIQLNEAYPFPYGFIPNTKAADGDCLDCYVLTSNQLAVGSLVRVVPVGLLEVFENGEPDHKILMTLADEARATDKADIDRIKSFISKATIQFPNIDFTVGSVQDELHAHRMIQDAMVDARDAKQKG